MNLERINRVYFIGVGGIGMSALARYFNSLGKVVAGYDRVSKPLTQQLEKEGVIIHYEDEPGLIPSAFTQNKKRTLVVYTPAIKKDHKELNYFRENGYAVLKRSEVLGEISRNKTCMAVAGTHGKTSVSSMLAHLLNNSSFGCNAFLGGILKNYDSNLIINKKSNLMVVEADEFDRSFLNLSPNMALITSIDEDHLDIYNDKASIKEAFEEFAGKLPQNGTLVCHKDVSLKIPEEKDLKTYTYSLNAGADFYASNIEITDARYRLDLVTPRETLKNFTLSIPGLVNVENAVAALTMAYLQRVDREYLFKNLSAFQGVQRRFDIQFNQNGVVYIDDYAHHPREISYTIRSVRDFYPKKKIIGVFQPHLYSRTQHFAYQFSKSLEQLDEVILLDVYPAREEPIPGVNSEIILKHIENIPATICAREDLPDMLSKREIEALITMGAGDIDRLVGPICDQLQERYGNE
ncbi:MAG: UDP-N-acetylmuramate--L-alanine ligase [Bacteroidales bacterium]